MEVRSTEPKQVTDFCQAASSPDPMPRGHESREESARRRPLLLVTSVHTIVLPRRTTSTSRRPTEGIPHLQNGPHCKLQSNAVLHAADGLSLSLLPPPTNASFRWNSRRARSESARRCGLARTAGAMLAVSGGGLDFATGHCPDSMATGKPGRATAIGQPALPAKH